MLEEFVIPHHDGNTGLREANCNQEWPADILEDLADHDALFITEDCNFDRCKALARNFVTVSPLQRCRAVDALAASCSSLCSSAQGLLHDYQAAPVETILRHKNGLRMFVYLLHTIALQAQKDAVQAQGAENVKAKPAGRSKKAAAGEADEATWDWQHSRQRILLAVLDVVHVDLKALFQGLAAAEQLISLCMELALQALESPAALKQESTWPACKDILTHGAVMYQQLDFLAAALMDRARKHEHVPQLAASLAKYAEEKYNSTQLAMMLLSEFCRTPPADYDAQYGTNQVSVRLASDVVACLAKLQPKLVSNQISQLQPYLGCSKASCIRGALVAATGHILVQVYPIQAMSSSLGAGAAQAHLRSKEALLRVLSKRIMDKAAFVRQKALQTWGKLVENSCLPLPLWNSLLGMAVGRLEDESQLVVRAALQLINIMMTQGIFQPPLKAQVYVNTLQKKEAELAELQSTAQADADCEDGGSGQAQGIGGTTGNAAHWEDGDIKIKPELVECDAETSVQATNSADGQSRHAGAEAGHDAQIQGLRTMIASLKEGAAFCGRLTAALSPLQTLLASSAHGVVHDAVIALTLCKTFEVAGAAKALRGMWPLVFSKHEQVRHIVLDGWHILHVRDRSAKQQVEELCRQVIPESSLSELTALEAIITALVQQGKISAHTLMKLLIHDICLYTQQRRELLKQSSAQQQGPGSAGTGNQAGVGNSSVADSDQNPIYIQFASKTARGDLTDATAMLVAAVRQRYTLVQLLAAAEPSSLDASYVPPLLEVAFARDVADAWAARSTCLALHSAAACLCSSLSSTTLQAAAAIANPAVTVNTAFNNQAVTPEQLQSWLTTLVKFLVAQPGAELTVNWPSVAEAAAAAVYALSPEPQVLMTAVLQEMFRRCKPGLASNSSIYGYSTSALARFFLVLGQTALQHLLCIEQLGKAIRATRLAADRAAAEAVERRQQASRNSSSRGGKQGSSSQAKQQDHEDDDISAQLGVSSIAADAELDMLVEQVEAQVLSRDQLLGQYGQLLSKFCHLKASLAAPEELKAAAVLALAQLMAVDAAYCSDNIALLLTLLVERHVSAPIRINIVVALADLASRFPNVLEPWTGYIYQPLTDPVPDIRLAALSSITHLVLGGMLKANGHVAKVAALLVDDEIQIFDRAALFFESLAMTGSGGGRGAASVTAAGASAANPVYNLLPDCLSRLLTIDNLREEQLQNIMRHLLAYVKDKQAEALRERLVCRLQSGDAREWRLVAWCIGQLGYSEKGLRRVMELTNCYRHTLGEQEVFGMFMTLADKGRRSSGISNAAANIMTASQLPNGPSGDLHSAIDEWVADLTAARQAATEAAEVEAAAVARKAAAAKQAQEGAEAARQQQQQQETEQDDNPMTDAAAAAQEIVAAGTDNGTICTAKQGQYSMASKEGERDSNDDFTAAERDANGVAADSEGGSDEQIALLQSQPDEEGGEPEQQLVTGIHRLSLAAATPAAVGATAHRRSRSNARVPSTGKGTAVRSRRSVAAGAAGGKQQATAAGSIKKSTARLSRGRAGKQPATYDSGSGGNSSEDDSETSSDNGYNSCILDEVKQIAPPNCSRQHGRAGRTQGRHQDGADTSVSAQCTRLCSDSEDDD